MTAPPAPPALPAATTPDVRLVPAAVTGWAVTAAGIEWSPAVAVWIGVGAVLVVAMVAWRWRRAWPAVFAVAAVGVAFVVAVGLRVQDVRHHPVV
ncbi:MAG: competence protein, partial [Actinomycetota bacterium]|nr:competence protein [Actinomycetota bacterium]